MPYRPPQYRVQYSLGGGSLTPAVKLLLILTAAAFFLQVISQRFGIYLETIFGLVPYRVTHRGFVWQPVSYLFLHGGLFHLGFNLLVLWMFGGELERVWGQRYFLKYYFLCGVGAGLCVVALSPSGQIPTIGASGALYGVLLAYGLLFPTRQIFLWFLVPIQAKYFVLVMGAIAFYSSLTVPGSGVSHLAHLGGLAVGYIYLRGWRHVRQLHGFYLEKKLKRLRKRYRVVDGDRDESKRPPHIH
ncbi:MAG: rhomboid family intramembrane serine protease [bacterium]